jgi:hypothetical protein
MGPGFFMFFQQEPERQVVPHPAGTPSSWSHLVRIQEADEYEPRMDWTEALDAGRDAIAEDQPTPKAAKAQYKQLKAAVAERAVEREYRRVAPLLLPAVDHLPYAADALMDEIKRKVRLLIDDEDFVLLLILAI